MGEKLRTGRKVSYPNIDIFMSLVGAQDKISNVYCMHKCILILRIIVMPYMYRNKNECIKTWLDTKIP